MKTRSLYTALGLAFAFAGMGCERKTIVIETAPPTPVADSVPQTKTVETSRLGAAIDTFQREPTAENRTDAKKAFADLDGEIAELEEHVAKRTGGEREEAAVKLRNLQAYRAAETTRFTAIEARNPNVPPASGPNARVGVEKLENTAQQIGDRLENAARKAGDKIEDVAR